MYFHTSIKYRSLLSGLLWVISFTALFTPPPVPAASIFDTDDPGTHIFEEDSTGSPSAVDDDLDVFPMEPEDVINLNPPSADPPLFSQQLIKASTLTLGYEFALAADDPHHIITNRTYVRYEFETLLKDRFFFRFDGKGTALLKNDHRADAKDKSLFFDGTVRELYLTAGFGAVSIKLGQQVMVWGKTDTAAVTDIVSARDLSEFIFTDLEDARLGQFMLSSDIYLEAVNISGFISPFPEVNLEPETHSRYHRAPAGLDEYQVAADTPDFRDMEWGIKISKTIARSDISLMTGRFFANSPVFDDPGAVSSTGPLIYKRYVPYHMVGGAMAFAWQNMLFKTEAAVKQDFGLQGIGQDGTTYQLEYADILDTSFGLEYNTNGRYTITVELFNRHLFDDAPSLSSLRQDDTSLYAVFSKDFFNQTLNFEYDFYFHLQDQSRFHQLIVTYDLTDHIEIKAGCTIFQAHETSSPMWLYRNEDRFSLELKFFY